jgi:hypothetical protein
MGVKPAALETKTLAEDPAMAVTPVSSALPFWTGARRCAGAGVTYTLF